MKATNNDLLCKRCKNERLLGSHLCRECTLKEQHKSALFVIESQKQELATLRRDNGALRDALKAALEHENHEAGKCGCGWTLKAREVLEAVGKEE